MDYCIFSLTESFDRSVFVCIRVYECECVCVRYTLTTKNLSKPSHPAKRNSVMAVMNKMAVIVMVLVT